MKVKCPTCKKKVEWEGNPYRPFCSERCKLIDLGKWLDEEYVMVGERGGDEKKDDENSNN